MTADVRVVCATHQDLERLVSEGTFREDLYYRIRVVEIEIPPLRARGEAEVEQLARHNADMYAKSYARPSPVLAADALAMLRAHAWPGNVRELEHWIESAIVLAPDGKIRAAHLPKPRKPPSATASAAAIAPAVMNEGLVLPHGLTLEEAERRYLQATLDACDGNKAEAARRLAIGRNTIGRVLKGERESFTGGGDED
jgi:Nif-specific regulatory protein